jgi:serine/threonine protein kinase
MRRRRPITRGEYAPAGDVFSLGAVLYEALTGLRPFPGDDAVSVSYAVVHDPHAPPSQVREGLSPAIDAVFARALSKQPDGRYLQRRGAGPGPGPQPRRT